MGGTVVGWEGAPKSGGGGSTLGRTRRAPRLPRERRPVVLFFIIFSPSPSPSLSPQETTKKTHHVLTGDRPATTGTRAAGRLRGKEKKKGGGV